MSSYDIQSYNLSYIFTMTFGTIEQYIRVYLLLSHYNNCIIKLVLTLNYHHRI